LGAQQRALGLLHGRLERCLVDAVQKISFPHPLALLEQHGIEVARNAGAYLDPARGLDPAHELDGSTTGCFSATTTPTGTAAVGACVCA
jgi:hypothetical protein